MQKFYTNKIKINKAQNGKRLDQAITNLVQNLTRSQVKILIQNNNVRKIDKIINNASCKVKINEEYNIEIPKVKVSSYRPENIPLKIEYEDSDIIVLNKSSGMVTHPAAGNESGTLVHALLNHTKNKLSDLNNNRPGIVHRLDKDTSGLMVVAKNNTAHLHLSNQFKNHTISRKYKAIVWGLPQNQIISGYIERNKINRKKMSLNQNKNGKFSKTIIKVIKYLNICSIVECTLTTGRTHQVRVHMTSINSPLVGDSLYGKSKINKFGKDKSTFNKFLILKNFQRQALHAYHIGFIHPTNKKFMIFESKFPEDIKNLLDLLLKY